VTRPGERVRVACARWFDAATMARVVDPVIADLQSEYTAARRRGRRLHSGGVLLVGYFALLKTLLVCEWTLAAKLLTDWPADDHLTLRRMLVCIGATTVGLTLLIVAWPLAHVKTAEFATARARLWLFFLLSPQALGVTIPFGLALGTALAMGGRRISLRLAHLVLGVGLLSSVLSFVTISWVTPTLDRAFGEQFRGQSGPPAPTQLTLPQLAHELAVERRAGPIDFRTRSLARLYYTRLGLCFAAFSFAVMVLAVVTRRVVGRLAAGLTGLGAPFGYYAILALATQTALSGSAPEFLIAWLPNVTVILMAVVIVRVLPPRRGVRPTEEGHHSP